MELVANWSVGHLDAPMQTAPHYYESVYVESIPGAEAGLTVCQEPAAGEAGDECSVLLPGEEVYDDVDVEPADGRAARSHRTRRAIIDAMRALHAEGELRPTVPKIAERAGVSLRTVWQQFADREALLVEAVKRDREIQRSLVARIDPDQPLSVRVEVFANQRARVLEEMTPTWRAARVQQPFSHQLQYDRKRRNSGALAEVRKVFAPELDQLPGQQREQLVDALHAISLWAFWESLRTDLGLSPLGAKEILTRALGALLSQAGFALA